MAGNAPKKVTLIVSIVLVALAIVLYLFKGKFSITFLSDNTFWVAVAGYVVLLLGNIFKGF